MRLIRHLADYQPDAPLALAIGNFDGLHAGHRAVLARMQQLAEAQSLVPAVLTFEPHPRQFFAPASPPFRIETPRDKLARLAALGVARAFALPFNAAMAARSPEAFLEGMLRTQMGVSAVVTGEDFAFGQARAGTIASLRDWGSAHGITTAHVPPVTLAGEVCSSTVIRQALQAGDMARAARFLQRDYTLSGRVRHGEKRGRTLGFPTANILPHPRLMLPRFGVYAVRVWLDGSACEGVANLGIRPTVDGTSRPRLEVHLLEYAGDLYGRKLEVALLHFLREEKRFDSLAALTHQMALDVGAARAFFMEPLHAE